MVLSAAITIEAASAFTTLKKDLYWRLNFLMMHIIIFESSDWRPSFTQATWPPPPPPPPPPPDGVVDPVPPPSPDVNVSDELMVRGVY